MFKNAFFNRTPSAVASGITQNDVLKMKVACGIRFESFYSREKNQKSSKKNIFFDKKVLADNPKACNFIKKQTLAQVFSCKFLRTALLHNTSGRLLLNVPNQNAAELAHCIIVCYAQDLGTCFVDIRILVWHLFPLGLLKPLLLHLIQSQVGNLGTLLFRVT